jgi:ABC-type transporter Mla MlaB component
MRYYQRLAEHNRLKRRSIMDALEVLRQVADFRANDYAEVQIGLLKLPSAAVIGLVDLTFAVPHQDKTYLASLPSSAQFDAARVGALKINRFDIAQLDRATVDSTGRVVLADGTNLCSVEVIPIHLPYEPSELDWRIVHHTISLIGAEERRYRHLADGSPSPLGDSIRKVKLMEPLPDPQWLRICDPKALDCANLSGLSVPQLKVIKAYISDKDSTLKKLSEQKIADALRTFGIRVPSLRPRRSRSQVSATI